MIKSKETITLFDLPLFTKVSLKTPMKDPLRLPPGACYAYIVDGDGQQLEPSGNISATPGQVTLSLCEITLGRIITEQPRASIDSIVVHLNQTLMQRVFEANRSCGKNWSAR